MWQITSINNELHTVTITHRVTRETKSFTVPDEHTEEAAKLAYITLQCIPTPVHHKEVLPPPPVKEPIKIVPPQPLAPCIAKSNSDCEPKPLPKLALMLTIPLIIETILLIVLLRHM